MNTSNEPPSPRAYHSMTCISTRYLLFGGFDGKTTFGDFWWLVPGGTCNSYFHFVVYDFTVNTYIFFNVVLRIMLMVAL
jgi:hypothetical protein